MLSKNKHLETARRVVAEEAAALSQLEAALNGGFVEAVDLIMKAKGRVIVSGIGKSGHIARKIAATLASTGTPAQFVHPAEASHGDLGMVTAEDIVLAVSNSGEAPELSNVVTYVRRFTIPLIAITSRPASALGKQADCCLIIPALGEACGHGVVPTVSTTMTLALGDALAVALMEARDFTPMDFHAFHPGGNLGARLQKVSALMHKDDLLPLVQAQTPMPEALLEITQKGFGVVGVTGDDGRLIGVITDGDLRRHMSVLMDKTAGDVMTRNPATITPDVLAEEAVARMTGRITCLFVVGESGKAEGILHIHDCLRAGVV